MWLNDGTAAHDQIPTTGFTLLRVADRAPSALIEAAFQARGIPLQVIGLCGDTVRDVYERDLVLVRPDLHVVWRGDHPPVDPDRLAAIAAGFGDSSSRH